MAKELLMFYGTECPHCHEMDPLVEKLEKELKLKVKKLEVWHNEANLRKMKEVDKSRCTGVPYFYNEATGESICGAVDYPVLKKWAQGKK